MTLGYFSLWFATILRIPAEWFPFVFAQQVPVQPQNLVTLQWAVIVALGGAVAALYRQLLIERDKRIEERQRSEDKYIALLEKALLAFSGSTAALEGIGDKLEAEKTVKGISEQLKAIEARLPGHVAK